MKNLLILLAFVFAVSLTTPAQSDKKVVKKDAKTVVVEKNIKKDVKKDSKKDSKCEDGSAGCCSSDKKEAK